MRVVHQTMLVNQVSAYFVHKLLSLLSNNFDRGIFDLLAVCLMIKTGCKLHWRNDCGPFLLGMAKGKEKKKEGKKEVIYNQETMYSFLLGRHYLALKLFKVWSLL